MLLYSSLYVLKELQHHHHHRNLVKIAFSLPCSLDLHPVRLVSYGKHKIIIQKLFKAQNPCFDNNLGARLNFVILIKIKISVVWFQRN